MKRGLNTHLKVSFDIPISEIKKIEFVFANSKGGAPIKIANYPEDVAKANFEDSVLIPFTAEETYKFEKEFFLDTRITLNKTNDQPETPIIKLDMNETLFEEEKEQ